MLIINVTVKLNWWNNIYTILMTFIETKKTFPSIQSPLIKSMSNFPREIVFRSNVSDIKATLQISCNTVMCYSIRKFSNARSNNGPKSDTYSQPVNLTKMAIMQVSTRIIVRYSIPSIWTIVQGRARYQTTLMCAKFHDCSASGIMYERLSKEN